MQEINVAINTPTSKEELDAFAKAIQSLARESSIQARVMTWPARSVPSADTPAAPGSADSAKPQVPVYGSCATKDVSTVNDLIDE